MKTLKSFYSNVRPWGWWKPVYLEIKKDDEDFQQNNAFWFDMMNCVVGIIWQSSMIVLPIYLLIRDYPKMWVSLLVFLITSVFLKYTWLDRVNQAVK